jgi:large subunit ribosomal protein L4
MSTDMPKAKLYDLQGKLVGEKELSADVFGVSVKPTLVHEVMVGMQASARRPWAHAKTRGEVRGGGKKPWRQKGTGRARHGSIRSPIWAGGGITFGPRSERDYTVKINRKAKKQALLMTLSDKVANEKLLLVEQLAAKDGKTKAVAGLLAKLPIKGRLAMVIAGSDALLARGTRNLKTVRLSRVGDLSLLDVLRAEYVLSTPEAVEKLEKMYGKKA